MLTRITTTDGGMLEVMGAVESYEELNDDGTPIVVQASADERLDTLEQRYEALQGELAEARQAAATATAAYEGLLRDVAAHRGLDAVTLDEPMGVPV